MPAAPLAYFITFTTYGTWLHGRDTGSVDKAHNEVGTPFLPPDGDLEQDSRGEMSQPPYLLDGPRREIVLKTLLEVANHRRWSLWAVHVRGNHVHAVVSADAGPEKVMSDFKAYASRRLKEHFAESADRRRWTQHGSTLYLWTEAEVAAKCEYVINDQGEPMAVHDGRAAAPELRRPSEPEA